MTTLQDIVDNPKEYGMRVWISPDGNYTRIYINLWYDLFKPIKPVNEQDKVWIDCDLVAMVFTGDAIRYAATIESAVLREAQEWEDIECGDECECEECQP